MVIEDVEGGRAGRDQASKQGQLSDACVIATTTEKKKEMTNLAWSFHEFFYSRLFDFQGRCGGGLVLLVLPPLLSLSRPVYVCLMSCNNLFGTSNNPNSIMYLRHVLPHVSVATHRPG